MSTVNRDATLPEDLQLAGWTMEYDEEALFPYVAVNESLLVSTKTARYADGAIAMAYDKMKEIGKELPKSTTPAEPESQTEPAPDGAIPGPTRIATSVSTLSVAVVQADSAAQPRALFDQEIVDGYAEAMLKGDQFPPIVVFHDGKKYWLGDGSYRTAATRKAGLKDISVIVHEGTQRDAILYSLSANETHGQPRTNADKRRVVMTCFNDDEWKHWSDGAIAEKCRVSQPFVSKLRRDTQNVLSESEAQSTRIGTDGVARDTSNIGRKTEAQQDEEESIDREANPELPGMPERPVDVRTCRDCGCTDETGCEGGCTWVADDLCSACQAKAISAAGSEIKVTDKRRFAEPESASQPGTVTQSRAPEEKRQNIEALLKGRMLSISFVFIPNVPGVSVSVNANDKPEKATRKLLSSDKVPNFPSEVLDMISEQLGGKVKTRSTSTKKPASKKPTKRAAPAKKAAKKKGPSKRPAAKRTKTSKSKRKR